MSGFRSDHLLVRDYVTAMDHLQYTQLPEDVVCVHMTHSNLTAKHMDIRLNLHMTIQAVKEKFHLHIGTTPEYQRLMLRDQGHDICELADNTKMLGYYSVTSGMDIHVIDMDPFSLSRGGGLTDVSLVQKYRMSDDEYSQRKGSMREFIKQQREKDPNFVLKPKKPVSNLPVDPAMIPGIESVEGICVDMRCQVNPGERRGIVKFVGEVNGLKPGYWVGVNFDEPVGHNDGTVKGVKIFDSVMGHGAFVRGDKVSVGDYPERDLLEDSDDDKCCASKENLDDDDEEI